MRFAIAFLFYMVIIPLHAQSIENLVAKADKYYDEGNFLESAKTFDKAFEVNEGNAYQYYNAACSWALANDSKQSIKYLQAAVENGWKDVDALKNDDDLNYIHSSKSWPKILDKAQANLDAYENSLDQPLKAQLENIYVRDQTLRLLYVDAEKKFGRDSEEMKYFWKVINEQDSINEIEVEAIIEQKGWVGKSLVGDKANKALWLVIQHAPLVTQEKYLPLLEESVKKEDSNGSDLALLEDRILMRNGKPQKYGSQISLDQETGEAKVYKIESPEYVDQRRKEVGLGPIEDYVKKWGIEWAIPQKEN